MISALIAFCDMSHVYLKTILILWISAIVFESTADDDGLFGGESGVVTFNTMSSDKSWVPTHWGNVEVISFDMGSKFKPAEILPRRFYELRYKAERTETAYNSPIAPLPLDRIQDTLKEILYKDMLFMQAPMSSIEPRPDGLMDVGLIFLAEIRLQILASINKEREKAKWEVKVISEGGDDTLRQFFKSEYDTFFDRLDKHVKEQIRSVVNRSLKSEVKRAILRLGIQFATRVRFDIACPSVIVRSVNNANKAERSNDWRARVVLVSMIPVIPLNRMHVSTTDKRGNDILQNAVERKQFYGGVALGWTPWKALMLHGPKPFKMAQGGAPLDRFSRMATSDYLSPPKIKLPVK